MIVITNLSEKAINNLTMVKNQNSEVFGKEYSFGKMLNILIEGIGLVEKEPEPETKRIGF